MTPELKAELRRLRRVRFYYLNRQVPIYAWKDAEGTFHDMSRVGLDHLQACICMIEKDIKYLASGLVSSEAKEILGLRA